MHPLRRVRQTPKSLCGDCDGFRPKVKSIELEAEQMEQAMLYAHAREHWPKLRNRCGEERAGEYPDLHPIRDARPDAAYDGVVPRKLKEAAIGLSR